MPTTDELLGRYRSGFNELWDRIQAVQALHVPVLDHTSRAQGPWCLECTRDHRHPVPWPCDTTRAAEGDDDL